MGQAQKPFPNPRPPPLHIWEPSPHPPCPPNPTHTVRLPPRVATLASSSAALDWHPRSRRSSHPNALKFEQQSLLRYPQRISQDLLRNDQERNATANCCRKAPSRSNRSISFSVPLLSPCRPGVVDNNMEWDKDRFVERQPRTTAQSTRLIMRCKTVMTAVLTVRSGLDPHMISGNGWVDL
ncbi:hypothetical protein EJB05_44298, partial [Eragrostis curvula]